MGRWAQAEEAVKPVCFVLSDAASYITGQQIAVDRGFHSLSSGMLLNELLQARLISAS